jgi:proteasome lid subunit RPN8/RPN11
MADSSLVALLGRRSPEYITSKIIMVSLQLTMPQRQQLATHARSSYPAECCGVLVGRRIETIDQVMAIYPTTNAWSPAVLPDATNTEHSPRDRYSIDPADLFAIMQSSRASGLTIIGIYHSHPDHPAIPSECDRQLAWPEYCYVIVSVMAGVIADQRGWRLDHQQQFREVEIRGEHSA